MYPFTSRRPFIATRTHATPARHVTYVTMGKKRVGEVLESLNAARVALDSSAFPPQPEFVSSTDKAMPEHLTVIAEECVANLPEAVVDKFLFYGIPAFEEWFQEEHAQLLAEGFQREELDGLLSTADNQESIKELFRSAILADFSETFGDLHAVDFDPGSYAFYGDDESINATALAYLGDDIVTAWCHGPVDMSEVAVLEDVLRAVPGVTIDSLSWDQGALGMNFVDYYVRVADKERARKAVRAALVSHGWTPERQEESDTENARVAARLEEEARQREERRLATARACKSCGVLIYHPGGKQLAWGGPGAREYNASTCSACMKRRPPSS